jgi:hypothetical protein
MLSHRCCVTPALVFADDRALYERYRETTGLYSPSHDD